MSTSRPETRFAGLSVLVVEDEALLALMLEDMLAEAGIRIVGPAMNHDAALRLVDTTPSIDAALLDVNVGGAPIYPLAARLVERGVPIVFATGYGREGLSADWQAHPVVQKPYATDEICGALAKALDRQSTL